MKRILILNPYISTLGGGEKQMCYFCKVLLEYLKDDAVIDILVFNTNGVNVYAKDYITVKDLENQFGLTLNNVKILKMNLPLARSATEDLKNKYHIEKVTKGYDLFVNFMYLSRHIGHAKKNIYQCFFPPKQFSYEFRGIKKISAQILDYLFYHSYDKYITCSDYSKHWMEEYWGKSHKNITVYSPVFSEDEIDRRYNEDEKENLIISVGRFFVGSHSKKQKELVEFFSGNVKKFSDYEYHLIGAISGRKEDLDYLSEIKVLANKCTNIHIHVNCNYNELVSLYKKAKIFWHATGYGIDEDLEPEKMEHFGITTVEAMSYGVVPVVINKGGQKETVQEGANGFLWTSEDECVLKTHNLMLNESLRKEMATASVEKAKSYSVAEYYKKSKEVLSEIKI